MDIFIYEIYVCAVRWLIKSKPIEQTFDYSSQWAQTLLLAHA